MKKGWTELVFILDRSGSMSGLESDTIGGFNAMIDKQRKVEGDALVSTVLFDDDSAVLHDRVPLREVRHMTEREYAVGGSTALLDAVGAAIRHIGNIHKDAREEDVPGHTIFVITTDGAENASRHYSHARIRQMIERQKTQFGWEFLFLGANIDAVAAAKGIGIGESHAANYCCDGEGTRLNYEMLSEAIRIVRTGSRPLTDEWKTRIEADYRARQGAQRR